MAAVNHDPTRQFLRPSEVWSRGGAFGQGGIFADGKSLVGSTSSSYNPQSTLPPVPPFPEKKERTISHTSSAGSGDTYGNATPATSFVDTFASSSPRLSYAASSMGTPHRRQSTFPASETASARGVNNGHSNIRFSIDSRANDLAGGLMAPPSLAIATPTANPRARHAHTRSGSLDTLIRSIPPEPPKTPKKRLFGFGRSSTKESNNSSSGSGGGSRVEHAEPALPRPSKARSLPFGSLGKRSKSAPGSKRSKKAATASDAENKIDRDRIRGERIRTTSLEDAEWIMLSQSAESSKVSLGGDGANAISTSPPATRPPLQARGRQAASPALPQNRDKTGPQTPSPVRSRQPIQSPNESGTPGSAAREQLTSPPFYLKSAQDGAAQYSPHTVSPSQSRIRPLPPQPAHGRPDGKTGASINPRVLQYPSTGTPPPTQPLLQQRSHAHNQLRPTPGPIQSATIRTPSPSHLDAQRGASEGLTPDVFGTSRELPHSPTRPPSKQPVRVAHGQPAFLHAQTHSQVAAQAPQRLAVGHPSAQQDLQKRGMQRLPSPSRSSAARAVQMPQRDIGRTSPAHRDSSRAAVQPPVRSLSPASAPPNQAAPVPLSSPRSERAGSALTSRSQSHLSVPPDKRPSGLPVPAPSSSMSSLSSDPSISPAQQDNTEHAHPGDGEEPPNHDTSMGEAPADDIDAPSKSEVLAPRFEEALMQHPESILASLLTHLDYESFRPLRQVFNVLRQLLYHDTKVKELVLERYLGGLGYRTVSSLPSASALNMPNLSLRDLDAFQAGTEYSLSEYAIFAAEHKRQALDIHTQRMIRAATRAYNKLVIRVRSQPPGLQISITGWKNAASGSAQVYKQGRTAVLRVWIPTAGQWMSDNELVECEREVHRSGVWEMLERGDLVRNVAVSDIANEGMTIFDGRFLRDLAYTHDSIGHLPSWLNALSFSPSYFHNQMASSSSQPVFYVDLSPFAAALQAGMVLCKEKTDIESPSGDRYKVNRYVYRTIVELKAGTILGDTGGMGTGAGPGGIEVLQPDWQGKLVIETEGTAEAANALLARAVPQSKAAGMHQGARQTHHNTPFRVIRSKSRPGQIWLKPVQEEGARHR